MKQDSKNYKVRCVGYKCKERYFTIGKVYDVVDGKITNDSGYTYNDWTDVIEFLSDWYNFERVADDTHISRVIFNDPVTIILWADGKKTVAKTHGDDAFDPEKGFAVACAKKLLGNGEAFRTELAKWIPVDKTKEENRRLTKDELRNMQGQKVWLVPLDENGNPDVDEETLKEYGGWHKIEWRQLYSEGDGYYDIKDINTPFGFHAYREPPKK